jgi:N-methylhydantoinase B
VREYEVLEDHVYSQGFMGNDTAPPRGAMGGRPGSPHRIVMWPGTPQEDVRHARFGFGGPLHKGDRIRTEGGGGGGWGDPAERDSEAVLADVVNELVGVDEARETYRVAITGSGPGAMIDAEETARLRAS